MAQADCLVLPSRHDGWGAVVSEALLVGTPAVCSDACGAAGVARASGVGGVFATGDVEALSSVLRRIVSQGRQTPDQRARLAKWACCLGASAGADYLARILGRPAGVGHPPPPWIGA
jgi:glycosyltransferase involved in cell wall biosynthesis